MARESPACPRPADRVVYGLGVAAAVVAAAACAAKAAAPDTVSSGGGLSSGGSTVPGAGGDASAVGVASGVTVLASPVFAPQSLALDSGHVYFTTAMGVTAASTVGDASAGTGAVERVARGGGGAADVVAGLTDPFDVAVTGQTLAFSLERRTG
jgi:hypothetical protein